MRDVELPLLHAFDQVSVLMLRIYKKNECFHCWEEKTGRPCSKLCRIDNKIFVTSSFAAV